MPNDIKAFLTKKVGPLPMGVWIGVGAVGLYVAHKRNQANAAATTPSTDTTASTDLTGTDQNFPSSAPPPYLPTGSQDYSGAYGNLPPINVYVTPAVPGTPQGGLTAHQLHLAHLAHLASTQPKPHPALTPHQLHLLHLQHLQRTGGR